MQPLPLAQKVKIIKETKLTIPVYRAPTEDYDPDRPSKFDSHIVHEPIQVSQTVSALIGIIRFLTKELLLTNKPFPKDTWKKLAAIKTLLRDQQNTIRR
jgi:hypothetical protein|tara:strand:+ start:196 stop:492 length:297 start_codon:yes stop_codon:yes gene_type:complete